MTLTELRCLCALVDSGSFHAAAAQIHRSQPAVSQQLKALERETGYPLIERDSCRPTPIGLLLYNRARQILEDINGLDRALDDFDEGKNRELRLGTSDTTALYFLPPFVRAFSRIMPQTRLVIVNRSSDALAEQVSGGQLDLGIVTLPLPRKDLETRPLFQERLVLITPAKHPLAKRRRVVLHELEQAPLLLLEAQTRTGALLREHFQRENFTPRIVLDSGSFEVIKRYVAEGIGCSFLPAIAVTKNDRNLGVIRVSGLPQVQIGAIWRRGAYRGKPEQVFLDILMGSRKGGRRKAPSVTRG